MKIIRITALWCMSCLVMNERLNKLKKEFNLQFEDYDFDYDEIGQFNVGNTLPVTIILNNQNQETQRLVGEYSLKQLKEIFSKETI